MIQNHSYLIRCNSIISFSHRVPSDVRSLFNKDHVIVSLHMRSPRNSQRSTDALSDRLERYWDSIRLEIFDTREFGFWVTQEVETSNSLISVFIQDALANYIRLKGAGRKKMFFNGVGRAIGYLVEAIGANELSSLSASDAVRFCDYLIGKSMTAASVGRVFGTVKAITNLAIRDYCLTCTNVFANADTLDYEKASSRLPVPIDNLLPNKKARLIDD